MLEPSHRVDDVQPALARRLARSSTSARSCTRSARLPDEVADGARDRDGAGGRGLRAPRHRAARRLDAARGARPAPPLVRRRQRARWPCCWPRRPTSTTSSRRSSPTRSSGTSCACGLRGAGGRAPSCRAGRVRGRAGRGRGRLDPAHGGVGRGVRAAARADRRGAAEPARADARRLLGGLRADDPPLVGAGARDDGRAGPGGPRRCTSSPPTRTRWSTCSRAPRAGASRSVTDWVERDGPADLRAELAAFRDGRTDGSWENFLYFSARDYFEAQPASMKERRSEEERAVGITHISSRTALRVVLAGHRARLARPALARPAARRPRRGAARPLPGGDRQHRVPARPRRLQHPARDHRGARHAARRLRPRQGGDAQRGRRRRDDLDRSSTTSTRARPTGSTTRSPSTTSRPT